MPLFIDRLPFRHWTDATRTPPLSYWSVVVPIILSEPGLTAPLSSVNVEDWVLDTGNRSDAFAWRQHLMQAGLDPDQNRKPQTLSVRTVSGRLIVPVREAELWLVSNIPALQGNPYRITLQRGLAFHDLQRLPDPEFERPLIGLRALRMARVRVEIDFAGDTVSVWTPDPVGP
jgi:hypothetical protein